MRLRIGFIGIGAMGFSHLEAVHENCADQAEVAAVCATDPSKVAKVRALVPGVRTYEEPSGLIASELDAIFISTPNHTHAPLAIEVLRCGKHLFLEKPIGIAKEECLALTEATRVSDRVVMVGHELRFSPYFIKIQSLLAAGEIGRPRMVWCREFRGPFQKKSRDWIQDVRQSGGALVDKNCHHFDLMNWWAGARPQRVVAFGNRAVEPPCFGDFDVIDHATVSFEYANRVHGSLQLCLFAPESAGEELEMGVVGDRGMLATHLSELEIWVWRKSGSPQTPERHRVEAQRGAGWGGHLGFTEIHQAFLDAILRGTPVSTPVAECLDGTLLAIAAEESIRRGDIVEVT